MEQVRSKGKDSLSEKNVKVIRENVIIKSNEWIATYIIWWRPAALHSSFHYAQGKMFSLNSGAWDFRVGVLARLK
jgi:hypothetical protein